MGFPMKSSMLFTNLHAVLPLERAIYSPAAVEVMIIFSVHPRQ